MSQKPNTKLAQNNQYELLNTQTNKQTNKHTHKHTHTQTQTHTQDTSAKIGFIYLVHSQVNK